jgi:holo-[acyl-carrier protein] synthase
MIIGLGTDVIEISRIKAVIERHGNRFLKRVYTTAELTYCKSHKQTFACLAGRFAAKEAFAKALGTGIGKAVAWNGVAFLPDAQGKPVCHLQPTVSMSLAGFSVHVSISHNTEQAMATVILEQP